MVIAQNAVRNIFPHGIELHTVLLNKHIHYLLYMTSHLKIYLLLSRTYILQHTKYMESYNVTKKCAYRMMVDLQ